MFPLLTLQLSARDINAGVIDKGHDKDMLVLLRVLVMCLCNVNGLLIACQMLLNEMCKQCFMEVRTKTALFF